MTEAEMRAAVDAAVQQDTYVVAHAASSLAINWALDAGIRSFEHAYDLDEETAGRMASKGVFLTPTLCVTRSQEWMRWKGFEDNAGPALWGIESRPPPTLFDVLLARTVGAIREITVERGLDPRELALVASGGAGPMLAPLLAREMELPEVVVPAAPAVFSAWGTLMSDLEYDLGQTVLTMLDEAALAQIEGVFAQLEGEADEVLAAQYVAPENRVLLRRLDLRYNGQEHTLSIELEEADGTDSVIDRFHRRHVERYGHRLEEEVQILTARVRAIGRLEEPSALVGGSHGGGTGGAESRVGERYAFDFATRERRLFPIYERSLLQPGTEIEGPAIIREPPR